MYYGDFFAYQHIIQFLPFVGGYYSKSIYCQFSKLYGAIQLHNLAPPHHTNANKKHPRGGGCLNKPNIGLFILWRVRILYNIPYNHSNFNIFKFSNKSLQ